MKVAAIVVSERLSEVLGILDSSAAGVWVCTGVGVCFVVAVAVAVAVGEGVAVSVSGGTGEEIGELVATDMLNAVGVGAGVFVTSLMAKGVCVGYDVMVDVAAGGMVGVKSAVSSSSSASVNPHAMITITTNAKSVQRNSFMCIIICFPPMTRRPS